jgi:ribosomal protein S18 acetylase RimI-like enzyme
MKISEKDRAVSYAETIVVPRLNIRNMAERDLLQVLEIGQQSPPPEWDCRDFFATLYAHDSISLVAEGRQQVLGFVICAGSQPGGRTRLLGRIVRSLIGEGPPPVRLSLMNLAVAAEWQRRGIARGLLSALEERLQAGDRIRAVVPESNLPLQLTLRSAGYRAQRVIRDYFFLDEDAYVMERQVV